jgi:hypothetical protein
MMRYHGELLQPPHELHIVTGESVITQAFRTKEKAIAYLRRWPKARCDHWLNGVSPRRVGYTIGGSQLSPTHYPEPRATAQQRASGSQLRVVTSG